MKVLPNLLAAAVLAGLSAPAYADLPLDVIGGSEVSFEGLIQADSYWYNNDVAILGSTGGATAGDGVDTDFGLRRAYHVLLDVEQALEIPVMPSALEGLQPVRVIEERVA